MPEHLRALVAVFVICATVLTALRRSFEPLMPEGAFVRRRKTILALIVCAFLAPNFWIYALLACVILLRVRKFEAGSCALFFSLLYLVPPSAADVPGFGLANFLLSLDPPRLLVLVLLVPLLPTALRARRVSGTGLADLLVCAYLVLQMSLSLGRAESFTNGLRNAVYALMDIGLPYFVVSRTLSNWREVRDAVALMCMTGVVLGAIGLFEGLRGWLLFTPMIEHWGPNLGLGNYLERSGVVRATASTGQPIVLGYVLMVSYACFLGVRSQISGARKLMCGLLLLGGLLATVSRGPWLGCAAAVAMYWAAATPARFRLALAASAALLIAFLVLDMRVAPTALKEVDQSTVDYRAQLLSASVTIFHKSPWFGSDSFRRELAEAGLVQGQGIVDIVNSYLEIALSSGLVGLTLFGAAFWSIMICVRAGHAVVRRPEQAAIGPYADGTPIAVEWPSVSEVPRVLISIFAGTIVTIATVSSISFISWTYWAFLGAGVAFARAAAGMRAKLQPLSSPNR
jgi:hypothetical protein